MDLSSLNVDVLLYLMKFVDPVDRFNLVVSGILKGFENANERIDLRKRIEDLRIELGPCRDGTAQLEIRSLEDGTSFSTSAPLICNSRLIALERLVNGGYFRNNRQLIVNFWWPSNSQLFRVIRFMTNLEKLNLLDWHLTLAKGVPKLFRSCPKLTELRLKLLESKKLEMNEKLKNELRSGFQRLRLFELHWDIDSWSLIQEIFTWLKECVQLTVRDYNYYWRTRVEHALTLNQELTQNLRVLNLFTPPIEFVEWILPLCPNIHTLKLQLIDQPNDLHNEIACLTKLKDLLILSSIRIDPKEIIRSCRQIEILRVSATITLRDLSVIEHYGNLKEVHLRRLGDSTVKEALSVFKRCTNLRRITFEGETRPHSLSSEELRDFIMELKHLTFLHIICRDSFQCNHFKSLLDEVKAFALPRCPNFKFYISCCAKFHRFRVPNEFFYK